MQNIFSAGSLWALRNDQSGVFTPIRFGVLQEVSFEFTRNLKELFGDGNLPRAIGAGTIKPTAKAKAARIFVQPYAELFFGQSFESGQNLIAENEAGTIPATPYAITVTNSADWTEDLGVKFAATGLPLTKVDTDETPTTGQYKCAAGVYTFAAADTTLAVAISYEYEADTGQKLVISNQTLGIAPTFQSWFKGIYQSKQFTLKLYNCVSSKLSFPFKLEDFSIPEFDFSMFVNDADVLGELSAAE